MAPSRVMMILLVLVPLVAMVSADEGDATAVEDLGDDDALGRRAGRTLIRRLVGQRAFGRGGMSTAGFFQMGFQGNHEEDTDEVSSRADELGEPRTGVEPPISSAGSSGGVFDLGQAASAHVAAEMADEAVAQKFSPEGRAEIK